MLFQLHIQIKTLKPKHILNVFGSQVNEYLHTFVSVSFNHFHPFSTLLTNFTMRVGMISIRKLYVLSQG